MNATPHIEARSDPVLDRFCAALRQEYGARIERIVLYGSRARGDARPDSDYDIALFLHDLEDVWGEIGRLAGFSIDTFDDTGGLVHALTFRAGAWQHRTPLMHEMRREGIDL